MRLKKKLIFLLTAVFLLNTAAYLKSKPKENVVKVTGQIVEFTANKLTVMDEKALKMVTFEFDTKINIQKETSIKLDDIKNNTYGKVVMDEDTGMVLEQGKTDITYVAKKVILEPDDKEKKSKFENDKIKGFISSEKGQIKVSANDKTYTFKTSNKFKGVSILNEYLNKDTLKKGLTVFIKGKKDGNRFFTEEIEIKSNE